MGLELKEISHRFGDVQVLRNASISVASSEIICLVGPSGCGKTTLLRLAAGLEPLQSGVVSLGGAVLSRPGAETPPEKRPVGFVFQDFALFPHLTVENNVAFGLKGESGVKKCVKEQLDALGVSALSSRFPHELSGGQQQRVALARVLVRRPEALLLDEPFASIDVTLRRRLRQELRRTLKAQGISALLVTHDPEEALALGDRIALMRNGGVIEVASPEWLYTTPQSPEGAALFPGSQVVQGEVRGGAFQSALGTTPADGVGDGKACVVLRPETLSVRDDLQGDFTVLDVHFSGPGYEVQLQGPDGQILNAVFEEVPDVGARVCVAVDWSKAFIFPAP